MTNVLWIVFTVVLSALFSGLEIAYVSSNPLKLEIARKNSRLTGFFLGYFQRRPDRFIGTMVVGNNIVLVLYGILMSEALAPLIMNAWSLTGNPPDMALINLGQVVLSSAFILVVAEFLPKALFSANPEGSLKSLSLPAFVLYHLVYPAAAVILWITEGAFRIVGSPRNNRPAYSVKDLWHLVEENRPTTGTNSEQTSQEITIFRKALAFRNARARDCMVPRNDVVAVEVDTPIDKVVEIFAHTGYSKLPVFRGTIDHIIGYVHSFSVFSRPESLHACLKPVLFVPESRPIRNILTDLLARRLSLAVVVDEFGGTAGILTTEDVIEEIFGEIADEHDSGDELVEKCLEDGVYLFSGRLEIDYLNEKYGLGLPESEEYNTLAGFVLSMAGTIPAVGEEFQYESWHVKVRRVNAGRIEEIELRSSQ